MNKIIQDVTERIIKRSENTRSNYLRRMNDAMQNKPHRTRLSCGNLAHGFAACTPRDKAELRDASAANVAIISSYNDLLSAHQPYKDYPSLLKEAVLAAGGVAQFAAGVPAMCDGITQGQPGMELSLMSRDVIAMAAAVGLSHNLFDGGLMLGICDKIVPGLFIAAMSFGHLPFVFVPAGPMPSGISNLEKARIRQQFAEGKTDKKALLDAEAASYHSPGTCTFYGTANSNQLMIEIMGLHLPGASFINPGTALRHELTKCAARKVIELTQLGGRFLPISQLVSAKTIVNGMVGLLASGGSTNHTMHLVAMAKAAGFIINWDDFADLSRAVPLIAKIYPNGQADINHFQRAGGMAYFIKALLDDGLLHEDVETIAGFGLKQYTKQPHMQDGLLQWLDGPESSRDPEVLTHPKTPFKTEGGLSVLSGNLGRAVIKTSSLPEGKGFIQAKAIVFETQEAVELAFKAGQLNKDCIIVLRFQGPKACGMPELHKLTPMLGVLQDKGYEVALITDGRMSGASGKIPAAIHLTPEALDGGVLAQVQNGDEIVMDCKSGLLKLLVAQEELAQRVPCKRSLTSDFGLGRELFMPMRNQLSGAEQGACSLFEDATYE